MEVTDQNRAGRVEISTLTNSNLIKGKNYLLAISIDNYLHLSKLKNAVKDAESFIEVLTSKYDFDIENVERLYNEQASKSNIIRTFQKYVNQLSASDSLIIYYSGHGILNKSNFGFWAPYEAEIDNEATFIPNSQIKDYIHQLSTLHILLISDSCFSGSFFRTLRGSTLERFKNRKSRWAITSGHDNEPVADGENSSPFAEALINFLNENNNENLSTSELIAYVKVAVYNNFEQTPLGGVIFGAGDDGGEFFFSLKETPETAWEKALELKDIDAYYSFISKYPNSKNILVAKQKIKELEDQREIWKKFLFTSDMELNKFYTSFSKANKYHSAVEELKSKITLQLENLAKEEKEEEIWSKALDKNNYEGYKEYIESYPDGKYYNIAKSKLKVLEKQKGDTELWESVNEKANKARTSQDKLMAYSMYLLKFPYGEFAKSAQATFDEIQEFIKAEKDGSIGSYQLYLSKFHRPIFEKKAKRLIQQKENEETFTQINNTKSFWEFENLLKNTEDLTLREKIQLRYQELIDAENEEYLHTIQQNSPLLMYKFLEEYPDGPHSKEIRKIVNNMDYEEFKVADESGDIATLENYAIRFPNGIYFNDAMAKIEELKNFLNQTSPEVQPLLLDENLKASFRVNEISINAKDSLLLNDNENFNNIQFNTNEEISHKSQENGSNQDLNEDLQNSFNNSTIEQEESLKITSITSNSNAANIKAGESQSPEIQLAIDAINSKSIVKLKNYLNQFPDSLLKISVEKKIKEIKEARLTFILTFILLVITIALSFSIWYWQFR